MAQRLEIIWHLFVASGKMFIRDRTAVFFSFFLPLVIMLIFGVLNFGEAAELDVGVVDEAETTSSAAMIGAFEQVPILRVIPGRSTSSWPRSPRATARWSSFFPRAGNCSPQAHPGISRSRPT